MKVLVGERLLAIVDDIKWLFYACIIGYFAYMLIRHKMRRLADEKIKNNR